MDVQAHRSLSRIAAARWLAGAACAWVLAIAGCCVTPLHAAEGELLVDPSGSIGDELGFALDQDGAFVVTGSPGASAGRGAVHVFECTTTPCAAPVRLEASGGAEGDHFGASIALAGDTLVIAAPGRIPAAVYVFVRSGGTWLQQVRIVSPGGAPAAGFGAAVALSGERLVVGADRADDSAGAVYLYVRSGTVWNPEARLVAGDAAAGDRFGRAVALRGDELVVGAPFEAGASAGGFARGAVYLFMRFQETWSQGPRFVANNPADGDLLGLSVALDNGRIFAGAPMADAGVGAALLFQLAGSNWSQWARLSPPLGAAGDRFGWSVALADDGGLLVGAPYALDGCGTAMLFRSAGSVWNPTSEATLDAPLPAAMAGWAVAAAGKRFVVAAPGHAGALEHRGAVHLIGGGDALFRDGFELPAATLACEAK
jgi:hypothetical protein